MVRRSLYLAIGAVGLALLVWLTSHYDGIAEFSPHSLQFRTHSEYVLFGAVPLYRSPYKQREHELVKVLVEEGFVAPQPNIPQRWELIYHASTRWHDGFGPLYDVFVRNRASIIDWSRKHRDCAEIYWDEGFRLLRSADEGDVEAGREILRQCWRIESPQKLHEKFDEIKVYTRKLRGEIPFSPSPSTPLLPLSSG